MLFFLFLFIFEIFADILSNKCICKFSSFRSIVELMIKEKEFINDLNFEKYFILLEWMDFRKPCN